MKKLLKMYGLNSDMQYFEMIVNSFINGQYNQAKEQFKMMPKDNRKRMVRSALFEGWESGLSNRQKEILFDNL